MSPSPTQPGVFPDVEIDGYFARDGFEQYVINILDIMDRLELRASIARHSSPLSLFEPPLLHVVSSPLLLEGHSGASIHNAVNVALAFLRMDRDEFRANIAEHNGRPHD